MKKVFIAMDIEDKGRLIPLSLGGAGKSPSGIREQFGKSRSAFSWRWGMMG